MKLLQPHYFNQFECIGDKCINHCCKKWNIVIDEPSYQYYQSIQTPFGDYLMQNIETIDSTHLFKLNENQECPCFNDNHLCDIYGKLGEDKMCVTCKSYPRVIRICADVIEQTLSLSCPEVARIIIEEEEKLEFVFWDNIESPYTEIPVDDFLYNMLLNARSCSIDIMQIRYFTLWERQLLLIILSTKIQECIDKHDYSDIKNITDKFNDLNILTTYVLELKSLKMKNHSSLEFINNFVMTLILPLTNKSPYIGELFERQIVCSDPKGFYHFLVKYEQEFNQYMENKSTTYENFYVHMLFRYYMNSLQDKNVLKQTIFANINYLLIRTCQIISWVDSDKQLTGTNNQMIFSSISTLLEHNSDIYDNIFDILKEQNCTSLAYQAVILS